MLKKLINQYTIARFTEICIGRGGIVITTAIDIRAILIANIIGITILLSVARGHWWRFKDTSRESRIMALLFIICLISCVLDPLCSWADGKPGFINTLLVFVSNTWLYLANIAVSLCFHALVTAHLRIPLYHMHKVFLAVPTIILCVLLAVNVFIPIVFSVNDNVYCRTNLYWLYLAIEALIALDGLAIYLYVRHTSGKLKFFPAASFLVPAVIGVFIQSVSYGVSTVFPFYAVSFGCIATAFQNESLYKDQLTGLYNRSYFMTLEKMLKRVTVHDYFALMLDINGFKSINDTYGHNTGDQALVEASAIFDSVIRENGTVIRYAGDEFIIFLHNTTDINTQKTIDSIHMALAEFNRTSGHPFQLSVSVGYCKVNLKEQTMNELVDMIDKLMYVDKRAYYESNIQIDRRK